METALVCVCEEEGMLQCVFRSVQLQLWCRFPLQNHPRYYGRRRLPMQVLTLLPRHPLLLLLLLLLFLHVSLHGCHNTCSSPGVISSHNLAPPASVKKTLQSGGIDCSYQINRVAPAAARPSTLQPHPP